MMPSSPPSRGRVAGADTATPSVRPPQDAALLARSAAMAEQAGDLARARRLLEHTVNAAPSDAAAQQALGRVLLRLGEAARAAGHFAQAHRLAPATLESLAQWADAAVRAGDLDTAIKLFERLARKQPASSRWPAEKALALQRLGRFGEASRALRRLVHKHPGETELYRMLVATERLAPDDPLIGQMRRLIGHPRMSQAGKVQLGFALAKALVDTGATGAEIFHFLDLANTASRTLYPFDFTTYAREAQAFVDAQAAPLPGSRQGDWQHSPRPLETIETNSATTAKGAPPTAADAAFVPVFIVGMPRSGTTLVERILAAHPRIVAGGEAGIGIRAARHLLGFGSARSAASPTTRRQGEGAERRPLSLVSQQDVAAFRRAFFRHMRRRATPDWGMTDKSTNTHLVLGTLMHCLPEARFVILRRQPQAVALSIYRNLFPAGSHRYGSDLGDIARALHLFDRTIEHWQKSAPRRMMEIHYEALVRNPDHEIPALIAALGLEQSDACLASHLGGGVVETLSLEQVRAPIHDTQIDAWRVFAKQLAPFTRVWEALNNDGRP